MWVANNKDIDYTAIASHTLYSLIAISTKDGMLCIYDEDFQLTQSLSVKDTINNLKWHPTRNILAISWSNGIFLLTNRKRWDLVSR